MNWNWSEDDGDDDGDDDVVFNVGVGVCVSVGVCVDILGSSLVSSERVQKVSVASRSASSQAHLTHFAIKQFETDLAFVVFFFLQSK